MPSSGRFERRNVMIDVVPEVVEEPASKVSGPSVLKCVESDKKVVQKNEAPSEHSANYGEGDTPKCNKSVHEEQPGSLEVVIQNGKLRSRTFSGSQLDDRRHVASALHQLCLGGLLEESTSPSSHCSAVFLNCQSVMRRIRTFSSDRPLLTNEPISEKDQSLFSDIPAKCSPTRGTGLPRKQVECPF